MPRPYANPGSHPPLTPASKSSQVEIEHLAKDAIAYRLNGGPLRVISPAPYGIYNVLRQLSAVVDIESRSPEEVESITRLERELHEDVIAYEQERVDRENAVLYASTYPPPLVRERDERALPHGPGSGPSRLYPKNSFPICPFCPVRYNSQCH